MPAERVHEDAAGSLMRSLLFVPADAPAKLAKALGCGADALILDLEDSVAPERKEAARAGAAVFLGQTALLPTRPRLIVRVNGLATGLTDADLDAIVPAHPDAIMLPKAEGGASVVHLDAKLTAREAISGLREGAIGIVPIATETARSLFVAGTYGGAGPRLAALTWGAEDLATELGAETNRDGQGHFLDPYRLARTLCIAGAAAAGVPALDTVYVDFRNDAGLRRECEDARRDGFTGKMAIHPGQVATINDVFTPSPDAIARAQAIIAAFAAAPGAGVVAIGGVMYDQPHLTKAERLLARAKAVGVA
jgi:citrate lyase subunit beta / citryl-CoA lyase